MSLHNSSVSDIGAALSLSDDAVKEMLQKAEDRLLESMRTRTDPAPARLNIVQKGSTLDQRFEDLKSEMMRWFAVEIKKAFEQHRFALDNAIDHHMATFVQSSLDEMREDIKDIRMEWDEFQEDER